MLHDSSNFFSVLSQVCSAFFDRRDQKSLASRILDSAIEIIQADRGTVYWILPNQKEGEELSVLMACDREGKQTRVSLDDGVAGYVYRTHLPFLANDSLNEVRLYPKIHQPADYPIQSVLSVPMRTPAGRSVGVIEILNSKNGKFVETDIQVLQVLALFAAVAFEYREMSGQLSEMIEQKARHGKNGEVAKVIDLRTAKEVLEQDLIQRALSQTNGNKSQAARLLGITREGLRKAMKKVA